MTKTQSDKKLKSPEDVQQQSTLNQEESQITTRTINGLRVETRIGK